MDYFMYDEFVKDLNGRINNELRDLRSDYSNWSHRQDEFFLFDLRNPEGVRNRAFLKISDLMKDGIENILKTVIDMSGEKPEKWIVKNSEGSTVFSTDYFGVGDEVVCSEGCLHLIRSGGAIFSGRVSEYTIMKK